MCWIAFMKKNGSLSGKARLNLRLNQWATKQLATDNLNSKAGRKLIKRYLWLTLKKSLGEPLIKEWY